MTDPFEELNYSLQQFATERDWDQFHSPKNLAMALTVEAAELQECFQWKTETESAELNEKELSAVRDEIADVQLYLIRLAGKLNIDIEKACRDKMVKNAEKYPAHKVKGSSRKYTHYQKGDDK
ncbi:hypothetical protein ADIMK_3987 [Marinobacterium lacunae]|uniref:Nucleotide pyrophosphohydrolase n=1 Tax=Marinobacterium lacunae TaxID=1232683 RepID=A0A081FTI5_9GAMM|nr:nucleotide pyrophosphohydrolase [Marinobacterium lacunae]KEA61840.1 hypothetical protein ADIMK_3987 [Marinobacterium lacunae]